eukprot:COSAG02_NODE_10208_length_1995_cov_1.472046_2_plen_139_part_00
MLPTLGLQVERAGALFFELADAIRQASENILADIDPTARQQSETEATVDTGAQSLPRLGELLEQHGGGLKQYLLPLKKAGLTMERLLNLATSGASPEATAEEDGEAALRQALQAAGVKKIGHREQIVRAMLAAAAQQT